jgi:hypothetical protein
MDHCPQCGHAIPAQGKFCPACGTPRRGVQPSLESREKPAPPAKVRGGFSRWDIGALIGGAVSAGAWYYWSTIDRSAAQDGFTHFYIIGFTAVVVFFRKLFDKLLMPLQAIKRHIPRLVVIGVALALPYFLAHFFYKQGINNYPLMQRTIVWGTILPYILLRIPEKWQPGSRKRVLQAMGTHSWIFLLFVSAVFLGDASALFGDDFTRDYTRLEDGLRTEGFAQTIAGTAATVINVLVNGALVFQKGGNSPAAQGDSQPAEDGKQPVRYTLDVQTQDEKTHDVRRSVVVDDDRQNTLLVRAQLSCDKPDADNETLTKNLQFSVSGDYADWITIDFSPGYDSEGYKTARLVGQTPSGQEDTKLDNAKVKLTIEGATLEGEPIEADVDLRLVKIKSELLFWDANKIFTQHCGITLPFEGKYTADIPIKDDPTPLNWQGPRTNSQGLQQLPIKDLIRLQETYQPYRSDDGVLIRGERVGAATDGISMLLIQASFKNQGGKVCFSVEGEHAAGQLYPLTQNPLGPHDATTDPLTLTTPVYEVHADVADPQPPPTFYAFALYVPPPTFPGSGFSDVRINLKATLQDGEPLRLDSQDIPELYRGETGPLPFYEVELARDLLLVRPPVVLVHGTYDNPRNCWQIPQKGGDYHVTMEERLRQANFRYTMAEWSSTNGMRNPSSFETNQFMVWTPPSRGEAVAFTQGGVAYKVGDGDPDTEAYLQNHRAGSGGIKDALDMMRAQGFAATQADLVCHSQGGALARVYAKGSSATTGPRDPSDVHYTDPDKCDCWYHNPKGHYNFHRGDIRRLITLCSTHRGSEICRVMPGYMQFEHDPKTSYSSSLWTAIFLSRVDKEAGIYSGGFDDQTPGCAALKNIGATPIPSHAIACTAENDDLEKINDKFYLKRFLKIWLGCTAEMHREGFKNVGQPTDSENLSSRRAQQQAILDRFGRLTSTFSLLNPFTWLSSTWDYSDPYQVLQDLQVELWRTPRPSGPPIPAEIDDKRILNDLRCEIRESCFALRQAIFREPNDCTVSRTSALGGMSSPYSSTIGNVLHGYAARYQAVQDKIINLLLDESGTQFSPNGFPRAYP